jgi:hypothetical protein
MVVHGRTWTSSVACASVSLPLRDQLLLGHAVTGEPLPVSLGQRVVCHSV